MKTRTPLFFILALIVVSLRAAPEPGPVRVLFLGNSFTARNNLSDLVRRFAAAGQPAPKLATTAITYGGQTMKIHWELLSQDWVRLADLTEADLDRSLAALKAESEKNPRNGNISRSIQRHEELRASLAKPRAKWDYVVLQSWKDTEGGMQSAYVEYARRLAVLARQQGAKVIFYDTAPDTLNAAPLTAPPPRAPAEERARMLATLAAEFDGLAVPVPLVVWHCQTQRPDLALRYVKDFHLNQTTAYLTAATIYAMIFNRSPEGLAVNEVTDNRVDDPAHPELTPDGGPQRKVFDDEQRLFLQRTVATAVADFQRLAKSSNDASAAAPTGGMVTEDFSSGMDCWWAEGGESVSVVDGRLRVDADDPSVPGGGVATVWWRQPLPADFEWELDAHVVSSRQEANNLNLFFCYADPTGAPLSETRVSRRYAEYPQYHKLNGYIITFLNGTGNAAEDAKENFLNPDGSRQARVRLRRNPGFELLAETHAYHCRAGVTYRLKVVKRGGEIVFSVDGHELLRATDPHPWSGGLAGLRTYRTRLWWDNLTLRPLALSRN